MIKSALLGLLWLCSGAVSASDILLSNVGGAINTGAALEARATKVGPGRAGYQGRQAHWQQSATTALGSNLQSGRASLLTAANRLSVTGSRIGSEGAVQLRGNSIDVGATLEASGLSVQTVGRKQYLATDTQQQHAAGSHITGTDGVSLLAEQDIHVLGSQISSSQGQASLISAQGDIRLESIALAQSHSIDQASKGGWILSRRQSQESTNSAAQHQQSASVDGNTVLISAGRDIAITASSAVGTGDVALQAGRDITLAGAQSVHTQEHQASRRQSGLWGSGLGLAIGRQQSEQASQTRHTETERAALGTLSGALSLEAGRTYTQHSSDLYAAGDIGIQAQNIQLQAGTDSSEQAHQARSRSAALSIGLGSGGVIGKAFEATQHLRAAGQTESARAAALRAAAAMRGLHDTAQAGQSADNPSNPSFTGGLRISLSATRSQSQSQSHTQTIQAPTIQSGGAVTLQANPQTGSIQTQAALIQGQRVALNAHTIELGAAQTTHSHNSSKTSQGIGAGITLGAPTGLGLDLSASAERGASQSQHTQHHNSHIRATETARLASTGHTSLRGAVIEAGQVNAQIGGNLHIQSLQDTASASARQDSSAFGIGHGSGLSLNLSANQGRAQGHYSAVGQQSGISAGQSGFDITVQGHTQLIGGLIDSQADAAHNRLSTARLQTSDLSNNSQHQSRTAGGAIGYSSNPSPQAAGNLGGGASALPQIPQTSSGNAQSTTASAIAPGHITLTQGNSAANAQQIASLNRNVQAERAKQPLSPLPDLQATLQTQADIASATLVAGPALYTTVGDIKQNRYSQALADYQTAQANGDQAGMARAQQEMQAWQDGGAAAVTLHGMAGAVLGKLPGLMAAAGTEAATPYLQQQAAELYPYPPGENETSRPDIARQRADFMLLGSTAIGAATAGAAGAHVAATATTHNYLSHQQWHQLQQEIAQCQDEQCRQQVNARWSAISAEQDQALRQACTDLNSPACQGLLDAAVAGSITQQQLVLDGLLPERYLGGQDLNSNVRLLVQRAQAQDVLNACNANPAACDHARLAGSLKLLMTVVGTSTLVAAAPALLGEIALIRTLGGHAYCTTHAQNCLNLANTAAEILTGVPTTGVAPVNVNMARGRGQVGRAGPNSPLGHTVGEGGLSTKPMAVPEGVKLYPDGSLRTPDGKFASMVGSPAPGTTAAANYADFLQQNGITVVGKEISVNGPLGTRRYDIVVRDASGNLQGIEIKTGSGGRNSYQEFTDMFVNRYGAPGVGRISGESIKSSITIYLP